MSKLGKHLNKRYKDMFIIIGEQLNSVPGTYEEKVRDMARCINCGNKFEFAYRWNFENSICIDCKNKGVTPHNLSKSAWVHKNSGLLCEHANENPNVCVCPSDCYCKTRTCKNKPTLEYNHQTNIATCPHCGVTAGELHKESCIRPPEISIKPFSSGAKWVHIKVGSVEEDICTDIWFFDWHVHRRIKKLVYQHYKALEKNEIIKILNKCYKETDK